MVSLKNCCLVFGKTYGHLFFVAGMKTNIFIASPQGMEAQGPPSQTENLLKYIISIFYLLRVPILSNFFFKYVMVPQGASPICMRAAAGRPPRGRSRGGSQNTRCRPQARGRGKKQEQTSFKDPRHCQDGDKTSLRKKNLHLMVRIDSVGAGSHPEEKSG